MVDLPNIVKVRKLIKAFEKLGFKGNGTKHHKFVDSRGRIATITRSKDELPSGMVRTIFRQADLTDDEIKEITHYL